jgi:hypothetical protein
MTSLHSRESVEQIRNLISQITPYARKFHIELTRILNNQQISEEEQKFKAYLITIQKEMNLLVLKELKGDNWNQFIDFYVQSFIYGLFIGWIRHQKQTIDSIFNFTNVANYIPNLFFFSRMFKDIENRIPHSILSSIIHPIEEIFQKNVLTTLQSNAQQLLLTFYSDFLQQYDPQTKKDLGVIYTPDPIVKFIIHSIDSFLNEEFSINNGILDKNIQFLDPAAGTMTFPCGLISFASDKTRLNSNSDSNFNSNSNSTSTSFNLQNWFHDCFSNNFHAFEIMFVPYLIGYNQIFMIAEDKGIQINYDSIKLNLLLTNALEEKFHISTLDDFQTKENEIIP